MAFDKYIQADSEALVSALSAVISVPSVLADDGSGYPYGKACEDCLRLVLEMASGMGFKTEYVDGHCGWCEYGSGEEMVAVLAHLDVVPEGEGWKAAKPFGGEVIDGRIYGRGAMDDKGPAMAALYALKAIKDSGVDLGRRIRIIFGLNEESGSKDMKYYLAHGGEVPVMGFTPDGEYPVINGEKGIVNEEFSCCIESSGNITLKEIWGGTAHNIVPADAYAVFECDETLASAIVSSVAGGAAASVCEGGFKLSAKGVSAHGASPQEGVNAIGLLMKAMRKLPLDGSLKTAVHFLAEKIGTEYDGKSLGINISDELSGGLTLNMGLLRGDSNKLSVKLNYRYPVTKSFDDCGPSLEAQFAEAGFEVSDILHKPSVFMPADSKLVSTLLEVYRNRTGDMSEPKSIGGGTYAKAIPNIVAFGPIFPGDEVREHKPDEYMEVSRLIDNANIFADAMYSLASK